MGLLSSFVVCLGRISNDAVRISTLMWVLFHVDGSHQIAGPTIYIETKKKTRT